MEFDGLLSMVVPPTAVTLTFDLLIRKANQHIYEPVYKCDPNLVKFPSLVSEIQCSQAFRVIECCDLVHSPFDAKS